MSELLDELARSLAKPMPRSRVLRLVGRALVTAALPAALAKHAPSARAAPLGQHAHWCHKAVGSNGWKFCTQETDKCFPTCCPPERTCRIGKCGDNGCCEVDCPCPPDRICGGACCKNNETCVQGACAPKTCGPDITDALEDALGRVKSSFASWSTVKRYDACLGLTLLPGAAVSWDVRELGPGGRSQFSSRYRPDCGTCGFSVQVGTQCHYSGSVNYVAYGVMMRLCHDYLRREDSSIADWFSAEEMHELIYMHKNQTGTEAPNFRASTEWANAGYHSGSVRPTPPGDRTECKLCSKPYAGPGLSVNWLPNVIRPGR
ncbi:MAG TPA: hypothetical protein VH760_00585 [Gaiellaceae bacterium]